MITPLKAIIWHAALAALSVGARAAIALAIACDAYQRVTP